MIHGLAHVCFIVSDLNRSLEFYGGKLGFKTAFESAAKTANDMASI